MNDARIRVKGKKSFYVKAGFGTKVNILHL